MLTEPDNRVDYLPDALKWKWRPESQILENLGYSDPPSSRKQAPTFNNRIGDLINSTIFRVENAEEQKMLRRKTKAHLMRIVRDVMPKLATLGDLADKRSLASGLIAVELDSVPDIDSAERKQIGSQLPALMFPEKTIEEPRDPKDTELLDENDQRRQALRLVVADLMSDANKERLYTVKRLKKNPANPGELNESLPIRQLIGYYAFSASRIEHPRFRITTDYNVDAQHGSRVGRPGFTKDTVQGYFFDPRVLTEGIITRDMVEKKLKLVSDGTAKAEAVARPLSGRSASVDDDGRPMSGNHTAAHPRVTNHSANGTPPRPR